MSLQKKYVAKAVYDFSVDGGGDPGAITLADSEVIPLGALIVDVRCNVTTIVTGGVNAAVAITGGGVTLKASETIALSEWDATGIIDVIRAGNAGATGTAKYIPIEATSSAAIGVTSATAALTAGVVEIFVEYYLG